MFFAMFLSLTTMSQAYFLGLYSLTFMDAGNTFVNGVIFSTTEIVGSIISGFVGPKVDSIKATRLSCVGCILWLALRLVFPNIAII